jgi:predicted PurR-regulated permease PerM
LSFVLAPVVRVLRRVGLHRVPAVFLSMFFALAVILSVGGLIGMQASEIVSDIPTYGSVVDRKIAKLREVATDDLTGSIRNLTRWLPRATTPAKPPRPNAPDASNRPIPVEIHHPDPTVFDPAERLIPPVAFPLATTGIVFVVAIFILLRQNDVRDRLIRLFGLQDLHRTTRALDDAAHRLTRYLLAQLGVNALFGTVTGIGLMVIGVPNPLL